MQPPAPASLPSAHRLFRRGYARRLELSLAGGVLFHLALFGLVPPIAPAGSSVPRIEPVQMYDIPPEIEIPPAPPEVARPSLAGLDPFRIAEIPTPTVDLLPPPDVENPFLPKGPGETGLTGRIDVRQEDPVVLRAVDPAYPRLAQEAGAEGAVWVEVLVDRTGRVARTRIVRSEASRILEEAALAAARDYLFRPALQQGHPVPALVVIPFRFTLR